MDVLAEGRDVRVGGTFGSYLGWISGNIKCTTFYLQLEARHAFLAEQISMKFWNIIKVVVNTLHYVSLG